jgi:hypothetical protein
MKIVKRASVLGIVLSLILIATTFAQYSNPWYSVYQVQNLGTSAAQISVNYYDENGAMVSSATKSFSNVAAGGSVTVVQFTDDPNLNGRYSAVISSDQPIAAVANLQTAPAGSSYSPQPPFASYSGEGEGATSVVLPTVMYNWYGYYTEFYAMNVGSGTASNVDITYYPGTMGGSATGASGITDLNNTIVQYQSSLFSQENLTALGAPSGTYAGRFLGSAVITSDQPIVIVVNQHAPSRYKLMTYNGFGGSGSLAVAVPNYLRGHYGYYSTLSIANPSTTTTANVTITYKADSTYSTPNPGATVVANHTIAPGKALVRHDGPTATDDQSDLDDTTAFTRFFGSVMITSDIPIVAMVNTEALESAQAQGGTFNAVPTSAATTKISVPIIMADYYGYYTSLTIQNVSGSAGTVTITYTSDGAYSSVKNYSKAYPHSIAANGSINVYEGHSGGISIGDINTDSVWVSGSYRRFLGSAVITANVPIVAFVNEELDVNTRDSMYTYNAFNVTP